LLMRRLLAAGAILLLAAGADAEIEKIAQVCETGICLYWWPKLAAIPGWHHEREESFGIGANALAPDGSTFANAEVVMYAKAVYKPRVPETTSLEMFIAGDRREFLGSDPAAVIADASTLTTVDGQTMKSVTFFPKVAGNWERVTYGEEGDFYLVFTISSRSLKGYQERLRDYEALVQGYRTK